jgi:hypothetical protein
MASTNAIGRKPTSHIYPLKPLHIFCWNIFKTCKYSYRNIKSLKRLYHFSDFFFENFGSSTAAETIQRPYGEFLPFNSYFIRT